MNNSSKTKVLYILATGRTGSTILGNVLGEIEGFFHAGELRTLWGQGLLKSRWCGCGVPVGDCPFWSEVLEVGFESIDADEIYRYQRKEVRQRHALKLLRSGTQGHRSAALESYLDAGSRLYRAIAKAGGATVIVDSSKRQPDAATLRLMPEIDPYWLHLVRDPRAVAYSWQRQKASPGAAGGSRTEMLRVGPIVSTRRWLFSSLFGEAVRRHVDNRYVRVRYEDFVRDPERTLRGIADFVGTPDVSLPFDPPADLQAGRGHPDVLQSGRGHPDVLQSGRGHPATEGGTAVRLSTNHTAGGNPDRLNTGLVKLRIDDEWIERQSRSHRLAVTTMALPLLRMHGYPIMVKRHANKNGHALLLREH